MRALTFHPFGPGLNPGIDAIFGLSLLLVLSFAPRGFSPGSPVSPLLKHQHFQIPVRSRTHRHIATSSFELLSAPWVMTITRSALKVPGLSDPLRAYSRGPLLSEYQW